MKNSVLQATILAVASVGIAFGLVGCGTTSSLTSGNGNSPSTTTFAFSPSTLSPSANDAITVTVKPSSPTTYNVSWKTVDGQGFTYSSPGLNISVGGNFSGITTAQTTGTTTFSFSAKTSGDQFYLVGTVLDASNSTLAITTLNFSVK